ncbi:MULTISPECIES: tryptophan transporter [Bacillus]|uniref:Tryptophan transporter n=2 Tax=Bacillus TaxID=1386 RepID=A0A0M4FHP0_9BACI|nr:MULTISPECIES: tryptophan transporter [Bacillus]ALC80617.1 tryptophan transporter [Bacillus gobiensis]MBP1083714.1 LytS/YehU family sensor histidine kinase [Bacillus capparidis]MED1094902.1 tryptophan transporter [Bacillus capparidis]
MKTIELIIMALFIGIGAALHVVVPPIFGMKPDMMLVMMFMGILLFPKIQNVIVIGLVTGFISGLTTLFPAGFIPNVIDKSVTALVFFAMLMMVKKYKDNKITAPVLTSVGTLVSGTVFLTSALLIVGLPGNAGFIGFFVAVVLPAILINTVAAVIVYPIVLSIIKRSRSIQSAK